MSGEGAKREPILEREGRRKVRLRNPNLHQCLEGSPIINHCLHVGCLPGMCSVQRVNTCTYISSAAEMTMSYTTRTRAPEPKIKVLPNIAVYARMSGYEWLPLTRLLPSQFQLVLSIQIYAYSNHERRSTCAVLWNSTFLDNPSYLKSSTIVDLPPSK